MYRETEFVMSHRQYAVNLDSLRVEPAREDTLSRRCWVTALWFRKRNGLVTANVGYLDARLDAAPETAKEFLERHTDGKDGGDCKGRWDGRRYWGAQEPEVIQRHLELLRPMLESFPAVPDGYDGWWRF